MQRQHSPSSPSPSCRAKCAILRGLRPSQQTQKPLRHVCSECCIYCDIWKLATLVYSRVPSPAAGNSPPSSPCLSRSPSIASNASSISPTDTLDALKSIEAAFQTQRSRLSSILSICTVEGAEESEGLRLAHDRCLTTILDLMEQERSIREMEEETKAAEATTNNASFAERVDSWLASGDCGSSQRYSGLAERCNLGSFVGMAR